MHFSMGFVTFIRQKLAKTLLSPNYERLLVAQEGTSRIAARLGFIGVWGYLSLDAYEVTYEWGI